MSSDQAAWECCLGCRFGLKGLENHGFSNDFASAALLLKSSSTLMDQSSGNRLRLYPETMDQTEFPPAPKGRDIQAETLELLPGHVYMYAYMHKTLFYTLERRHVCNPAMANSSQSKVHGH